jgi:hypothetical protein
VELVTARRWPEPAAAGAATAHASERWVVIAAGKTADTDRAALSGTDVRIALVEITKADAGAEPMIRRLARTLEPLSPRANWCILPEDLEPVGGLEDCAPPDAEGLLDRTELTALDFAPYRIDRSERAFGIVTTMTEGYAGGYASYETLSLYRMTGERLIPILDVPIGVQKMLAGDWNPDQTRQHEWIEAELVLEVRPRNGSLADLALHSSKSKNALVYRFHEADQGYGCP